MKFSSLLVSLKFPYLDFVFPVVLIKSIIISFCAIFSLLTQNNISCKMYAFCNSVYQWLWISGSMTCRNTVYIAYKTCEICRYPEIYLSIHGLHRTGLSHFPVLLQLLKFCFWGPELHRGQEVGLHWKRQICWNHHPPFLRNENGVLSEELWGLMHPTTSKSTKSIGKNS